MTTLAITYNILPTLCMLSRILLNILLCCFTEAQQIAVINLLICILYQASVAAMTVSRSN